MVVSWFFFFFVFLQSSCFFCFFFTVPLKRPIQIYGLCISNRLYICVKIYSRKTNTFKIGFRDDTLKQNAYRSAVLELCSAEPRGPTRVI